MTFHTIPSKYSLLSANITIVQEHIKIHLRRWKRMIHPPWILSPVKRSDRSIKKSLIIKTTSHRYRHFRICNRTSRRFQCRFSRRIQNIQRQTSRNTRAFNAKSEITPVDVPGNWEVSIIVVIEDIRQKICFEKV